MPSRYLVPLTGIDPRDVSLAHVHAAFSAWFDVTLADHRAGDKPYAISPVCHTEGVVGVEIATLTAESEARMREVCRNGTAIRLGRQWGRAGRPRLMHQRSWAQLAAAGARSRRWTLDLVTPTTFRSGDRSSPLPSMAAIMGGLSNTWERWSDLALPGLETHGAHAWISDLDLRSEVLRVPVRRHAGGSVEVTMSGSMGQVTIRPTCTAAAPTVGALLELAAYAGVGSMTRKGFGVTRVRGDLAHGRQGDKGFTDGAAG